MSTTGIDYGRGLTNINHETGIRYGVIHSREVGQAWYDSAESDYGEPSCDECGNPAHDSMSAPEEVQEAEWFTGKDYYCPTCETCFWSDEAFGDEPLAWTFKDSEYTAEQSGSDCDIFVTRSPFYTFAPFCSPCAPGAGYLGSADGCDETNGVKTYCFGHEWFDDGRAPYRVFNVETNEEVISNG